MTICKNCYGKKQLSEYKGQSIASADFPGDKSYIVDNGGIVISDCSRCNGTGEEPEQKKDWIYKAIKRYAELEDEPPHYSNFRKAIEDNLPKDNIQVSKVEELIEKYQREHQYEQFIEALDILKDLQSLLPKPN